MTTTVNIDKDQSVKDFHDWLVIEQSGCRYYLVQGYLGEVAAKLGADCCFHQNQKNRADGRFMAVPRRDCQLVRNSGGNLWLDRSV